MSLTESIKEEIRTTWHFCISLDKLTELTVKGKYDGWLEENGKPLTELEVYHLIAEERAKGKTYFCGCDNQTPDGKCAGHVTVERVEVNR